MGGRTSSGSRGGNVGGRTSYGSRGRTGEFWISWADGRVLDLVEVTWTDTDEFCISWADGRVLDLVEVMWTDGRVLDLVGGRTS